MLRLFPLLLSITLCAAVAPKGPWDAFNFAPASKTVTPVSVRTVNGIVRGAQGLVQSSSAQATFTGNSSFVVLDWGKEVGGILSLDINAATPSSQFSFSFTESPDFIDPTRSDDSCHSVATENSDGVQSFRAPLARGRLTQTIGQQRGGFRFLTIVSNSDDPLTISNISLAITFMPHWDDLRAYPGFFFAPDPGFHDVNFLTKLWYAGAYTVQMNTIDSHQARQQPCGWANNATGGPVEGPILVDGAKRDRNIWPGDCGISSHTELVALNDLLPTKNALTVMFSTQDRTTGALQYSGPPINAKGSDTYIAWSLIGTHNYFLYTGDLDFVQTVWDNYTFALSFLQSQVDSTGLANVPAAFSNDWGRDGGAGHNSAFNALLYRTLVTAADLASHLGNDIGVEYLKNATRVKSAYNALLWDEAAGLFRDNDNPGSIHPQDGNSLAVLFGLTTSDAQNKAISKGLTQFWTPIGPLSPELNDTIIPFVGGFELQAHFIAGEGERAIDLMEREWGYMLYTNMSVQSTLLEGFTANGSLGYRAAAGYDFDHSYTSHAHGWATGPTPSLTFYVLGIQVTSSQGLTWNIAPVLSGLPSAEGGIETGLGAFIVEWHVDGQILNLSLQTPAGTAGNVTLPGTGPLTVNGAVQHSASGTVQLAGGNHMITRHL
ncbi:glycoside hydrolase family 78 protein [Mycena pura]|uniref:Glycoside hydrolase family 78 protein n=1 Tax=Mycena pura TaxID=153505 RepID=A0AAD6YQX4_9AGAR|nr:glycoside hydrolase family 78 protein [Mycena pura]